MQRVLRHAIARPRVSAVVAALLGAHGPALADPGTEAVGALVDDEHRILCTGTLVTPDAILTAAHCVVREGVVTWPWGFYLGEDVRLGGEFVRVVEGAVHPGYDSFLHTSDLAVLRIAGGTPRESTGAVATTSPAIGSSLLAVGFGAGAVGARPIAVEVTSQSEDSFRYQPGTCPGDSGGPILTAKDPPGEFAGDPGDDDPGEDDPDEDDPDEDDPDEDDPDEDPEPPPVIAGVVSTGAVGCTTARAVAVAAHQTWIRDAVTFLDPPGCRTGDGQCGEACPLGDGDCPCVADDGSCRLCAGVDPDCSPACEADGFCATSCVAPDPDCRTLEEGTACTEGIECVSSLCIESVCRKPCVVSTGAGCPPWEECVQIGDEQGVCDADGHVDVVGGCAAGRAPDPGAAAWALLFALLTISRSIGSIQTRNDANRRSGQGE